MKKIKIIIALLIAATTMSSCLKDLDQYPNIEQTATSVYSKAENYKMVLAKIYATFVLRGQEMGGGNADLSSNQNEDYLRTYFNMQQIPTDETAYTWLEGDKMDNIVYINWNVTDPWVEDMFYRIYYTITMCNEFLKHCDEASISGFTPAEQAEIRTFALDARFMRALCYSHAMDMFGRVPFVTEEDPIGAFIPQAIERTELFNYIESELKAISDNESYSLPARGAVEYGRASRGAAWTLLARIYLNAEVYTGTARATECVTYAKKVISEGYSIEPEYQKLFNADNNLRTNEIILAFSVDSEHSMSWGASTYMVCGSIAAPNQNPADYGAMTAWNNLRSRGDLVDKFDLANDGRALFFSDGQQKDIDVMSDRTNGYAVTKWTNLDDNGNAASNTADYGVNTDFPFMRLADVYLMLSEAVVRGGGGSSMGEAVGYVNELRQRAYGNTSGNITEGMLTLDFMCDERARELFFEGYRRTDLIRFGKFTGGTYNWSWKGGVRNGTAIDAKYNLFPIPHSALSANPNLYNTNY